MFERDSGVILRLHNRSKPHKVVFLYISPVQECRRDIWVIDASFIAFKVMAIFWHQCCHSAAQRRINSDPERWAHGWHGVTRIRRDLLFHAGSKTELQIRKVACQSLSGVQSFQLKHNFHFFSSRILWVRVEKESFFQPSLLHKMLRALRNTSQEWSRKTSVWLSL